MTTPTKHQSVRQQGSTLGQSAVGPSFLDVLFHQLQASKKNTPTAVIRAESCRPLFCPEFTGIETKTNDQRWLEYQQKLIARRAA